MSIWSNKSIARDLKNFVDIIARHDQVCFFDYQKLTNRAESLSDIDYCDIEEIELEFLNYQSVAKTVPQIESFKINLISSLTSNEGVDASMQDPIESCTFDIVVTGFCTDDGGNKEYKNCWHLDKDEEDDEGDGKQGYTHPLYHFQYGGRRIAGLTSGESLLMGAPRIPHPPMDIFLAIHFVLNNYFNKNSDRYKFLQDLYEDDDYRNILERAKQRMWYPYFEGLQKTPGHHQDLHLAKLFPLAS